MNSGRHGMDRARRRWPSTRADGPAATGGARARRPPRAVASSAAHRARASRRAACRPSAASRLATWVTCRVDYTASRRPRQCSFPSSLAARCFGDRRVGASLLRPSELGARAGLVLAARYAWPSSACAVGRVAAPEGRSCSASMASESAAAPQVDAAEQQVHVRLVREQVERPLQLGNRLLVLLLLEQPAAAVERGTRPGPAGPSARRARTAVSTERRTRRIDVVAQPLEAPRHRLARAALGRVPTPT